MRQPPAAGTMRATPELNSMPAPYRGGVAHRGRRERATSQHDPFHPRHTRGDATRSTSRALAGVRRRKRSGAHCTSRGRNAPCRTLLTSPITAWRSSCSACWATPRCGDYAAACLAELAVAQRGVGCEPRGTRRPSRIGQRGSVHRSHRAGLLNDLVYQQARFSLFDVGFGLILYGVIAAGRRWPAVLWAGFAATVIIADAFLFDPSTYTYTQSGTRINAVQQVVFYLPTFFVTTSGVLTLLLTSARSRPQAIWFAAFSAAILVGFPARVYHHPHARRPRA